MDEFEINFKLSETPTDLQIKKLKKIGRASCRERVQISVVAVSLKKKKNKNKNKIQIQIKNKLSKL